MRAKHVLLCWEFGRGGRHVHRLKAIGDRLEGRGLAVTYALQRPEAGKAAGIRAEAIRKAPAWPLRPQSAEVPGEVAGASYGDDLARMLLGPPDDLPDRLALWRALIEAERPDAVIADCAPSVSLLCHGVMPVVAIGNGYELPPPSLASFPRLADDIPLSFEEADIVQRVNDALMDFKRAPIERLPQVNRADAIHLLTFPCLDPYRGSRDGGWLGAPEARDIVLRMWPTQKLFACFDEERQTDARLMEGLVRARLAGTAIFTAPLRRTVRQLEANDIRTPDGPAYLPFELLSCGVLVHQGGFGMAVAGIAAGVPQVIVQSDPEAALIAGQLVARNAGAVLDWKTFDGPDLALAVRLTADDKEMQKAARDLSLDNTRYLRIDAAAEVASSVERLVFS